MSLRAVPALVLALLFPLALAATPGEMFLGVKRMQLYQDIDAGAVVALERHFWPAYPVQAEWTATVTRVRKDSDGELAGRLMCAGGGREILGAAAYDRTHLTVRDWLDDPECRLDAGEDYVLSATWRFHILGVMKTVAVQTQSQRLPALPSSLRPSAHMFAP